MRERELADVVPEEIDGDHRHLAREHHRGEKDPEHEVPEREAEVRERESDERARDRHAGCTEKADPEAVEEPAPDRRDVEQELRVGRGTMRAGEVPRPVQRDQPVVERLAARLERRADEPQEGIEEENREAGEKQDEEALRDPPPGGAALRRRTRLDSLRQRVRRPRRDDRRLVLLPGGTHVVPPFLVSSVERTLTSSALPGSRRTGGSRRC